MIVVSWKGERNYFSTLRVKKDKKEMFSSFELIFNIRTRVVEVFCRRILSICIVYEQLRKFLTVLGFDNYGKSYRDIARAVVRVVARFIVALFLCAKKSRISRNVDGDDDSWIDSHRRRVN